jgi:hypothetical protein
MNFGLKMKFEKRKRKKGKTSAGSLSAQMAKRPIKPPAPGHSSPLPLFFFFPRVADDWGPPVSLPFPPFLSSSSR